MGGGSNQSFGVPATDSSAPRITIEELDRWARGQWESILYYMVGSTGAGALSQASNVAGSTRALLQWGDFVVMKGSKPTITKNGFTFLLQEPNAQVWSLLIVYLTNHKEASSSLHKPGQS
jgi:transcription initiation factor TFIIH subunit 4